MHRCPECSAEYSHGADTCSTRFAMLLALDHSRAEPWGSRHGQAFAAFALQHPVRHNASLDVAWALLYRIYCGNEAPGHVISSIRNGAPRGDAGGCVPPRAPRPLTSPAMTIADLGDFAAATYVRQLDAWCRATLHAWGAPVDAPA